MVWKRLFGRNSGPPATLFEAESVDVRRRHPQANDPAMQTKLEQLLVRRNMAVYDLERAESARRPENPWRDRVELIERSLATIEDDLRELEATLVLPGFPLPATPIDAIGVDAAEPARIEFSVGLEQFVFEEEPDWDERGGPVVRGQLRQRAGNAAALLPPDIPREHRNSLIEHLAKSVSVFAVDLRNRVLEGEPLPVSPVLADLARPCPECGGWRDWKGNCDACAGREFRRRSLRSESARLARELDEEETDRQKWAERLPVARKRLADLDDAVTRLVAR